MSIANVAALVPQYRSRTEESWADCGAVYVATEYGERVMLELYEPVKLRLPGGWYTPDFMYLLETGATVFVEVKGSRKQKNYRAARSKLRAAAEIYRFWAFIEALKTEGGFELEVIG